MGKRGPKPQPTVLKLVRGETRPSRVGDPSKEVKPPPLDVEPPSFLDADAMAWWNKYAPSLITRGLLTFWDVPMFAALCTALAHYARAVELVNASNVLVKAAGHNHVVKHPGMQVIRDNMSIIIAISGRFGMSPADRNGLTIPESPDGKVHDKWSAANILD